LVKVVTKDIAISVGVITYRSIFSVVESLAFTVARLAFTYLLTIRVGMSFEFCTISRYVEVFFVQKLSCLGFIKTAQFEDFIDYLLSMGYVE